MPEGTSITDVLIIIAIVLGPLFGAFLAVWLQQRHAKQERRVDIFRNLMRTRRTPTWLEHVGALNLVEIEFHDNPKVISAWKTLFQHFGQPQPRHTNEEVRDNMTEDEKRDREESYYRRLGDERQALLSELLHAIGGELGFKIEQLEIFRGGYTPQGWAEIELEQTAVRRLFTDIYLGHRMFPIGVYHFPGQPQVGQEAGTSEASEPNPPPPTGC